MIEISIKIKFEDKTFKQKFCMPDDFAVCKANPAFEHLVSKCVEASHFEKGKLDEVKISASFEW